MPDTLSEFDPVRPNTGGRHGSHTSNASLVANRTMPQDEGWGSGRDDIDGNNCQFPQLLPLPEREPFTALDPSSRSTAGPQLVG